MKKIIQNSSAIACVISILSVVVMASAVPSDSMSFEAYILIWVVVIISFVASLLWFAYEYGDYLYSKEKAEDKQITKSVEPAPSYDFFYKYNLIVCNKAVENELADADKK